MTMRLPPGLRSRLALIVMLAVLLIPIAVSSLRGLTHVLTCDEAAETPFTIELPEDGPPAITSSATFEPGDEAGLCGGLFLDIRVGSEGPRKVRIVLPVTNRSEFPWKGSVQLQIGPNSLPVDIGEIPPGGTASDTLHVEVDPGVHEIGGSLLIGP